VSAAPAPDCVSLHPDYLLVTFDRDFRRLLSRSQYTLLVADA